MKTRLHLLASVAWLLAVSSFAATPPDLDAILARLGTTPVEDRYQAQLDLQALAAQASRPGAEKERENLASALAQQAINPTLPQPTRVWVVRQLELIGGKESVQSLEKLLADPDAELRESARRALERNGSAAAGKALLRSLQESSDPAWQAAVIHSLGERREKDAVPAITVGLDDPKVSPVAAEALGKVATRAAVQALWKAQEGKNTNAVDGLLEAAGELLARSDESGARQVAEKLYTGETPPVVRAQCLVILAKAHPATAKRYVAEALGSTEPVLRQAGLEASRVAFRSGSDPVQLSTLNSQLSTSPAWQAFLADTFPTLSAPGKILVLEWLDAKAESLALASAKADPEEAVRLAAFSALARIGGPASVPALLEAAGAAAGPIPSAAQFALRRAPGNGTDTEILRLSGEVAAAQRAAGLRALGERSFHPSVPILLRYAGETNLVVADAAFTALGRLGADAELEPLLRVALTSRSSAAEAAVQSVVLRCKNKTPAAQKLGAQIATAKTEKLPLLVDNLALLETPEASAALLRATRNQNEAVRDAAIRAVAASPLVANIPLILEIATGPSVKRVHNVLLLQGLARLIRASDETPAKRVKAALDGMRAAQRVDEQKTLLTALASIAAPEAARAIKPYLTDPVLKQDAGEAAVTLAESLKRRNPAMARELAQAVKAAGPPEALEKRLQPLLN